MIKLAKVIDDNGIVLIASGTDTKWYIEQGYEELEVQLSDIDDCWYLTEKCPMKTDEEKAKEEAERIAHLYLTGADVERGIYQAKGLDFDDIIAMVEEQAPDKVKPLKIELKANNFYRGNPYVEVVGKMLGFTDKQLTMFFETNDYTVLISKEEELPNENTTDTTEQSDIPVQQSTENIVERG